LWYDVRGDATMTTRRAVTSGGLLCLLAAWLASAASTTLQRPAAPVDPDPTAVYQAASTEALAAEVQAHAARLRQRLASAPVPQLPHRNPFAFEPRPQPELRQTDPRTQPILSAEPPPPPDPVLSLIGVAEDETQNGPQRTAILADGAESVLMVGVGETVLGRYRVSAIGADAVELTDLQTSAVRRLGLR
jgi:hypothetical protein